MYMFVTLLNEASLTRRHPEGTRNARDETVGRTNVNCAMLTRLTSPLLFAAVAASVMPPPPPPYAPELPPRDGSRGGGPPP